MNGAFEKSIAVRIHAFQCKPFTGLLPMDRMVVDCVVNRCAECVMSISGLFFAVKARFFIFNQWFVDWSAAFGLDTTSDHVRLWPTTSCWCTNVSGWYGWRCDWGICGKRSNWTMRNWANRFENDWIWCCGGRRCCWDWRRKWQRKFRCCKLFILWQSASTTRIENCLCVGLIRWIVIQTAPRIVVLKWWSTLLETVDESKCYCYICTNPSTLLWVSWSKHQLTHKILLIWMEMIYSMLSQFLLHEKHIPTNPNKW